MVTVPLVTTMGANTGVAILGLTTVTMLGAELLPGFGSDCAPVTHARLVNEPVASVLAVIRQVAVAPFVISPKAQQTKPLFVTTVPWLGVAETKLTPAGSASVTVTLVQASGPRF